jgi:NitT/TauT family transport system substrate-binding protein
MASKRISIMIITVVLAFSIALGSFFYLNSQKHPTGELESIDVAYSSFESVALFWIAREQGFFSQNGLNVTAIRYDTGAGALNGMINDEADIALGTNEFPLTIKALENEKIRTVASISESEFIYVVGRRDRGIEEVSDLKGKVVGTTFGTIAQFYLGRFLSLNGVNVQDITLLDLRTPEEWVNAVVDGDVDAVSTAQPYADRAEEGLGANAVVWSAQSHRPLFTQVISTDNWIANSPKLVEKFLKSLLQAEEYASSDPNSAKAIVKMEMNVTVEYMTTVWAQNRFRLSLDQAQVVAMEDEARWLISENLTSATAVPDFLEYIYFEGLESVKPESLNIIR